MNVILFGTGDYYKRYRKWFKKEEILALLDNSPQKQNTLIDGVRVLSPQEGVGLPYDRIVILSFYVREMKEQLQELGVPEEKICHFYDLPMVLDKEERKRPVQYYGNAREAVWRKMRSDKKILLLSHDMTLGGPAIALLHAARALAKHGYMVVYASMLDGPLRDRLLTEGIPVVVDENLQIETMKEADWTDNFSLFICNTINYHVFLSRRNTGIPVIWWLHDAPFFYDGIRPEVLEKTDRENLLVCSVGPIPERAIRNFLPDIRVEELLYGVEDTEKRARKSQNGKDKVCFVTIGYIEKRKGQDILVRAIEALPDDMRKRAVFYLIGQRTSVMALELMDEAKRMPEVIMTGTVGRQEVHKILRRADVMVCPSREDPMPTVAAEAMMHNVPCIVSDETGTSGYLLDKWNGFVFPSEDVRKLTESIAWCIEHTEDLPTIGKRARSVYETRFSMEVFTENLLGAVHKMLPEFPEGA